MSKRRKAHGRPQVSKSQKTKKRLAIKQQTLDAVVAKRKPNKNHKIRSHAEVEAAKASAKAAVKASAKKK